MRLSITSWSFPACTLSEAWSIAQALGFAHIDAGLLHRPALDRTRILADPQGAAGAITGAGMALSNLYWLFGAGLADRALTEADARPANVADFRQVCAFARAAGCPSIFVLPGVTAPGLAKPEALARSAESLRELLPIAQDAGIALTVEPHIGGILTTPQDALDLLGRVPGLGLTLDHAHFVAMGHSQDRIDPLLAHARHIHLRQARPGVLQAKWGAGVIDFAQVFESLRTAGYSGFLSVEYVHQAYMNTVSDDVLTETIAMRDLARLHGIR